MKNILLITFVSLLGLLSSSTSFAEDYPYTSKEAPLGEKTLSLSLDLDSFSDKIVGDLDLDSGVSLSAETYYLVAPRLYIGGSIGYGEAEGKFVLQDLVTSSISYKIDSKMLYIPLELNAKMTFLLSEETVLTLGGGASFNYNKEKLFTKQNGKHYEYYRANDWSKGIQIFAEIIYVPKYSSQYFGFRTKVKQMNDFFSYSRSYSHSSFGFFAGIMF